MNDEVRKQMIAIARDVLHNIEVADVVEFSQKKVMDLPENYYNLENFIEALSIAKYQGATHFNTNVGDKGFFKPVPMKEVIERDLNKLQELFKNLYHENPL